MPEDQASFLRSSDLDPAELENRARTAAPDSAPLSRIAPGEPPPFPGPHDPARIAELYERPVSEPRFSGGTVGIARFLRGPLRGLARFFYRLAAVLDGHLHENRSIAFQQLTREVERLREQIEALKDSREPPAGSGSP